jgi:putative chitinase
MEITPAQLRSCIGDNPNLDQWCAALNKVLPSYDINTPQRVAAFVAQCAHESANFKTLKENLNYRAEGLMKTWPKRFPTLEIANQYARQPEKIANKVYADRMGNGNEASGDGWRYSGRGLIQLTGKDNYSRFAKSINMDLAKVPAYLETLEGAVQSACWFWNNNNLNSFADKNDIKGMTIRINGGTVGLDDRKKHYEQALKVFGG